MALVKLGHQDSIKEGERIIKECYERCIVAIKCDEGRFHCYELPDSGCAEQHVDQIRDVPGCRSLSTYKDTDGTLWVNLPSQVPKPQVDKSFKPPDAALLTAEAPPPLVPFAGCDRKAMPPSPAKPFSLPASPLKPSPFKERVDSATKAVLNKPFQPPVAVAKRKDLFGGKKAVATEQPVQAGADV